ncbi:DUF4174 domain-containing protein [Litoreibacter roseus]|uniref:DUF4174 domain-containing protein n=1 Tax=Litoreibacter roseus TaxID=2601869 RepID=A0A6N6JIB4_9RHOB|nr:DUF4174 domain-containing protein [Litoreibacter roseus]GFE65687.1 hypothetical protein KIN_27610 [Litoreibacter roseus]
MKRAISIFSVAVFAAFGAAGHAQATDADPALDEFILDASEINLEDFLWVKRPIVVFAQTPADPAYQRQIGLLTQRLDVLAERDVVIITDTDPSANSALREQLRPRGFMLVLIGKDGGVKLRKPLPWDVREISRVIDKMPLRQQELRERRPLEP